METEITILQEGEYMGENPETMEDAETEAEILEVAAEEILEQ